MDRPNEIAPAMDAMKQQDTTNKLCLSCRRFCKQPATVVVASCPRYYMGPKIKKSAWKQMELPWQAAQKVK